MNTEDDEFARIAREQALNKMAENARELGLDYEPAQQEPVAWMHPDGRIWTFGRGLDKSTFTVPLYTSPPAQRKPLTDVIKAAQGVLEWTEIAHRPPKRDRLEVGRMAMVRLHALADLHDALTAHGIKENA